MSNFILNEQDYVLNINVLIEPDGQTTVNYSFSPHFFSFLRSQKSQREAFVNDLFLKLNDYIDEVPDRDLVPIGP